MAYIMVNYQNGEAKIKPPRVWTQQLSPRPPAACGAAPRTGTTPAQRLTSAILVVLVSGGAGCTRIRGTG